MALPTIHADNGKDNYIFISYAHANRDVVYPFIEELQKRHYVWFDEGIHYGNEWEEEIAGKLKNCSVFLFMITKESLVSNNCKDELYNARELNKPFINLLMDREQAFPDWFSFRYGRYQMCYYSTFSSPEAVIDDLERKCEGFASTRRVAGDADAVGAPEKERADPQPPEAGKKETSGAQMPTSVGSVIRFGRYVQKPNGDPEPIEWQVLAIKNNKALIISKYALDCQPYQKTHTECLWQTSSLRIWLNETFFQTAFRAEEQKNIHNTLQSATYNPRLTKTGLSAVKTQDRVFLLDTKEAFNRYFKTNEARKCVPTEYAISQGARVSKTFRAEGKATCIWWLRSPGRYGTAAACVYDDGHVHDVGDDGDTADYAVRPAMWIDLEAGGV